MAASCLLSKLLALHATSPAIASFKLLGGPTERHRDGVRAMGPKEIGVAFR